MNVPAVTIDVDVICRIGSLESQSAGDLHALRVICRIGSLEI